VWEAGSNLGFSYLPLAGLCPTRIKEKMVECSDWSKPY